MRKVQRRFPPLDAPLGFALLRDRRVSRLHKARALMLGGGVVAGIIGVAMLAGQWLGVPGHGLDLVADVLGLASGSLLFGALLLMRLAPTEVVSRLHCERYPVIPLRVRQPQFALKRADEGEQTCEGQTRQSDPLAALGYSPTYETPRYAVIPRRAR